MTATGSINTELMVLCMSLFTVRFKQYDFFRLKIWKMSDDPLILLKYKLWPLNFQKMSSDPSKCGPTQSYTLITTTS